MNFTLSIQGQKTISGEFASPLPSLWRVKHDAELPAGVWTPDQKAGIWRAGLPEVFPLNGNTTPFGKDWQLLSYAMNPGMDPQKWRVLYDFRRAFTNGTGFEDPSDPRADYVNNLDTDYMLPRWDKTRVCGGATVTGVISGSDLLVTIMDGRGPAPTLEWLKARPWLFFTAVNSTTNGITNFPQNGGKPVLVPLVGSGEARIPLAALERVTAIADPYKV